MSSKKQLAPNLVALPTLSKRASHPASPAKVYAHASVYFNEIGYCSLSEAVCAALLELFVPDFKIVEGDSYQVPMGNGASVDFMVKDVLLEYHGVRFQAERGRFGDFNSRQDYVQYHRRLRQFRGNRYKRQELIAFTRQQLIQNYFQRRRRLIDQNMQHNNRELVVVTSCDELYDKVIRRFNRSFCPNKAEFRQIFYALVKVIARENSVSRNRVGKERARA